MKKPKKLTEEEIDKIVIAEADDMPKREKPITVFNMDYKPSCVNLFKDYKIILNEDNC